jgi:hypothetical protein
MFWRGAGVGTYWHEHDVRLVGFTAQAPGVAATAEALKRHVAHGTVNSPYVSLTRSYGVATNYAIYASRRIPTKTDPAYVYAMEITDPLPKGLELLDPVIEVGRQLPSPLTANTYQHEGEQSFLHGVVDPVRARGYLDKPYLQPPPAAGTVRPPNLSLDLEALVRALRDSEVLALGAITTDCFRPRIEVW